jgi:ABC-type nitrate/sulfonate/bicarbonate transport system substrate-binding protein
MSDSSWRRRALLVAAGAVGVAGTATAFAGGEGFDHVQFVQRTPAVPAAVLFGAAQADIGQALAPSALLQIDAGQPVTLLADARIDAYLGFPPEPQELRNRKIGHVIFSTRDDRPWLQYFCCMVAANREFVRRNPAATKRALRAIVKGMEICAADPERAARAAAAHNPQARLDDVVQMVKDLRYGNWREFSAEDIARFFALRLRDIGMVKGSTRKLLARGSDWRFIDQLGKEMRT